MQEISNASQETSTGAAQVNLAIQQLDTVTQENTAASEELSSTAEELASQAEQLQAAIAFFKIDGGTATRRTRRSRPPTAASAKVASAPARTTPLRTGNATASPTLTEDLGGGFNFDLTTEDDLDAEFTSHAVKKDRAA